MGWSLGYRDGRWIGYGVPATCDHPDCGVVIDRGLSYLCGSDSDAESCGLFFCSDHLRHFREDDRDGGDWVCERCANDKPPFDPTPDVAEWIEHMLTDESWEQWRTENPEKVTAMRKGDE